MIMTLDVFKDLLEHKYTIEDFDYFIKVITYIHNTEKYNNLFDTSKIEHTHFIEWLDKVEHNELWGWMEYLYYKEDIDQLSQLAIASFTILSLFADYQFKKNKKSIPLAGIKNILKELDCIDSNYSLPPKKQIYNELMKCIQDDQKLVYEYVCMLECGEAGHDKTYDEIAEIYNYTPSLNWIK